MDGRMWHTIYARKHGILQMCIVIVTRMLWIPELQDFLK